MYLASSLATVGVATSNRMWNRLLVAENKTAVINVIKYTVCDSLHGRRPQLFDTRANIFPGL